MAKLRKMLGDINDESIIALMRLIETQSADTLAAWGLEYVENHVLNIYEKQTSKNDMRKLITSTRAFLMKEISLKEMKIILKEAKEVLKDVEDDLIGLASARAIITACAIKMTPTNALGFSFYCAAALVYNEYGLLQAREMYDEKAKTELKNILQSLQASAIENELYPVKINWNC